MFKDEITHGTVGIADHEKFGICSVFDYYEQAQNEADPTIEESINEATSSPTKKKKK